MEYLYLFITFVPVVLITVFIPYITRKTESFGVSVPEDVYHDDELVAMRKRYVRLAGWLSVLVILAIFGYAVFANGLRHVWVPVVAVFFYLICGFLIYLTFHFQMKKLKADRNWQAGRSEVVTVDTAFRNQKVAYSNGWFMLSFLITIGTVVLSWLLYDQIPDKIPMNYDFDGEVTRWADKSYGALLLMPGFQLFMILLFLFLNMMIGRYKQQIDGSDPEKSVKQNTIFRRRWSAFTIVTGSAIVLLLFFAQLTFIFPIHSTILILVPLIVVGGIVIGAIVLSFTTGQGGSRVKVAKGKEEKNINRDDDRHWKLGQFYFNPQDPAVWVEKRFGVGWTVNFAHPVGWGSLLAIVLIPLLLTFLTL